MLAVDVITSGLAESFLPPPFRVPPAGSIVNVDGNGVVAPAHRKNRLAEHSSF